MNCDVKKISIFWSGYPICGTRTQSLCDNGHDVTVYATRAGVPFEELSQYINHSFQYLDNEKDILNYQDEINKSDLFIFTGWYHKSILECAKIAKDHNTVTCMTVDNPFRKSFRQKLGKIYAYYLRKIVDHVMVAGESSADLMKYFGFQDDQIHLGYYGYNSHIYHMSYDNLKNENNYFLYVGQLIKRKGIDILIKAYNQYIEQNGDHDLLIIGSGDFDIPKNILPRVKILPFQQPSVIAKYMKNASAFILPSRLDHWGTVVVEAQATGTPVIISSEVYSRYDFQSHKSFVKVFQSEDEKDLARNMHAIPQTFLNASKDQKKQWMDQVNSFSEEIYSRSVNIMLES